MERQLLFIQKKKVFLIIEHNGYCTSQCQQALLFLASLKQKAPLSSVQRVQISLYGSLAKTGKG
ncbi:MAG: hypothetical protein EAZ29_00615, partial [Runella slithyformis]